ncbi:MAG: hypothetical protein NUV57_03570, partial [archaeon]|nr:hypothetical protein [archaeon]
LYILSETALVPLQWTLNELISCNPASANCPNFSFSGRIKPVGALVTDFAVITPETPINLMQGREYELILDVLYLNQTQGTLTGVATTVENTATTITVANSSTITDRLVPNVPAGASFILTPLLSTDSTKITFGLNNELADNNVQYEFVIADKQTLQLKVEPMKMLTQTQTTFVVTVQDSAGNNVPGADVVWAGNNTFITPTAIPERQNGVHIITIPGRPTGNKIFFKATRAFYNASPIVEVNVVDSSSVELSPVGFECVTIVRATPAGAGFDQYEYQVTVPHGNIVSFDLKATNCPSKVKVGLNVPFVSTASTQIVNGAIPLSGRRGSSGSWTTLLNNCDNCDSIVLEKNDTYTVRTTADKLLGQYDVEVRLKYDDIGVQTSTQEYKLAYLVQVIVTRDQTNPGQLFSIDKTRFNIITEPQSATITNHAFAPFADYWYPIVNFTQEAQGRFSVEDRFDELEPVSVNWTVTAKGLDAYKEYLIVTAEQKPACETPLPGCFQCAWICSDTSCGEAPEGCEGTKTFSIANPAGVESIFLEEVWFELGGGATVYVVDLDGVETKVFEHVAEGCTGTAVDKVTPNINITPNIIVNNLINADKIKVVATTGGESCSSNDAYAGVKIAVNRGSRTIDFEQEGGPVDIVPTVENRGFTLGEVDLSQIPLLDFSSGDFVDLSVTNTPSSVKTWLEGSTDGKMIVKGTYVGTGFTRAPAIPFSVVNNALVGRAYGLLKVEDYVRPSDITIDSPTYPLIYKITATDSESASSSLDSAEVSIPADGVEVDLGLPNIPVIAGTGVSYTITDLSDKVISYFKDSRGRPVFNITKEDYQALADKKVYARTAYAFSNSQKLKTVILVDTSGSMDDEWASICATVEKVQADLQVSFEMANEDFNIIGMQTKRSEPCAEQIRKWPSDFSVNGTSLAYSYIDHAEEAWGVIGYDLIKNSDWSGDSRKMMLIISDNDPTGAGSGNTWRTDVEEDVVAQLVKVANEKGISLFFLSPSGMEVISKDKFGDPAENDATELMKWAAVQTGGEWSEYSDDPNNDFGTERFVLLIERSLYNPQAEYFQVRLDAGKSNVCYGANDEEGITGADAVPRILPSWDWDDVLLDSCDYSEFGSFGLKDNSDFAYCDATQFTTELLKKLDRYNKEVIIGSDSTYAGEYLGFNSYLMRDGYTADFKGDYAAYLHSLFEQVPDSILGADGVLKLLESNRIIFNVPEERPANSKALPSTGIYAITISHVFDDPTHPFFFVGQNKPNVTINVTINLVEELRGGNMLYYLPIDGKVGELANSPGVLDRVGYGTGFTGDISQLGLYTLEGAGAIQITAVQGTPLIPQVILRKYEDFTKLNNTSRGNILALTTAGGATTMEFTPSQPVPIAIVASNTKTNGTTTNVPAYLVLKSGASGIQTISGDYLTRWTGFSSNLQNSCTMFNGNRLSEYKNQSDSRLGALASACKTAGNSADNAFGFEWSSAPQGSVGLKTIFYVPQNSDYFVANPCQALTNASLNIYNLNGVVNTNTQIPLASNADIGEVVSLTDIFDLIENEYVCVSEGPNKPTKFWWNPEKVFNDLVLTHSNAICPNYCGDRPDGCSP